MFLQLFDSVQITKGYKQAILTESNEGWYRIIPLSFYDLLSNKDLNYNELKQTLAPEEQEILEEYIKFILDNRLGFFADNIEDLVPFKSDFKYIEKPTHLEYLIIDIGKKNSLTKKIINEIILLNIQYLQIRITEGIELKDIEKIISDLYLFNDSAINEISFVAEYSDQLFNYIKNHSLICEKYLQFILHSAPVEKSFELGHISFHFVKSVLHIPLSSGVIKSKNFVIDKDFYLESQVHNNYLYKKIGIDQNGEIRNCPSMPQSYGNIKDTTLQEALNKPGFKKYWNLTKDEIEVCKDCEFRYICTDCRAYTERTHTNQEGLDISKPLKCGYNPYTGEW
ncbi:MAG: grasp-with-spasm system SPASM domain peptide maturase, partial [Flavobacteriaceae bacterium]|nr:grasp-with-spasm system SPASM domain peptide maturase [Flavobacteriaceae bacterium]